VLVALRVDAPAARAFAAFTEEIGEWWQPNALFRFTERTDGRLAFEPDPPKRLVEIDADGERFEIGAVTLWDPPHRLVFDWRQSGFPDGQSTKVSVRFDALDEGTRVTVEHFGWDGIPQENAARHGFPLGAIQERLAEWWQEQLGALAARVSG
jgi:uncharacterized protein YndB with AHSA1/START domain